MGSPASPPWATTVQGNPCSGVPGNVLRQTMPTKPELRRRFRKLRRALPVAQQRAHAREVAATVLRSRLPLRSGRIGIFLAADGEPDTAPLISRLWALGKCVTLPVIRPLSGRLEFYRFDPAMHLVPGEYDIPVPPDGAAHIPLLTLDLLLLPLVAFDLAGTRLGMGGGFYDRTLGRLPAVLRPPLVGLAHECQLSIAGLPREPNDSPLDAVVTETGLRTFTRRIS